MTIPDEFLMLLGKLGEGQIDLIREMASHMVNPIQEQVNSASNLLTSRFRENFSNRLVVHHATHEEKFKKKSFEFAFCAAYRSDGRVATIVVSQTNPGADVVVDGGKFSLKTEASAGISQAKITISKLMEARWIRDCKTKTDFARCTQSRIVKHLNEYERIVVLRAFNLERNLVRYDLIEIPKTLLLKIESLKISDFRKRTAGGGSGADVYDGKTKVFSIRFDGSVEKVTVSGLLTEACFWHGSWTKGVGATHFLLEIWRNRRLCVFLTHCFSRSSATSPWVGPDFLPRSKSASMAYSG